MILAKETLVDHKHPLPGPHGILGSSVGFVPVVTYHSYVHLLSLLSKESNFSLLISRSYLQLLDHEWQCTLRYEECQGLPDLLGGHRHGHARVAPAAAHKLPGAIPDSLLGN